MLSLLKSGAAHAQQILPALECHFLGEFHHVLIPALHRLDFGAFKHGVGAGKLRTLFILYSIGKNRGLYLCIKMNPFFYGKHLTF